MTVSSLNTTDLNLQKAVQDELACDPSVLDAAIGVAVEHGVVMLFGNVENFFQKWQAGAAAMRIHGARGLVNDIEVHLPGDPHRTDADIARSAIESLGCNAAVPAGSIQVSVSDGWITLSGYADWHYQKTCALDAVRCLRGVRGVTNEILIKPRVKADNIRAWIDNAFRRSATINDEKIYLEISLRRVTLRGEVPTLAEREEAERAAWTAPGVISVRNLIAIRPRIS